MTNEIKEILKAAILNEENCVYFAPDSQTHAAKEAPDFNRGEELANSVGKINAYYSL